MTTTCGVLHHVLILALILILEPFVTVAWSSSYTYQEHRNPWPILSSVSPASFNDEDIIIMSPPPDEKKMSKQPLQKIILWRGEKSHGNDLQFRHLEFTSALASRLQIPVELNANTNANAKSEIDLNFSPALSSNFTMAEEMVDEDEMQAYENAMQYISALDNNTEKNASILLSDEDLIKTVQRCSLVRSLYEIVAEGETYPELAKNALASGNLNDLMNKGRSSDASWRVRLRQYGNTARLERRKQYGRQMKSPVKSEREAIHQMGELFDELTGPVDLNNAEITLYLFEGLLGRQKVLARLLTRGAETSVMAPKTRICVTNTPLCPLAAFAMCNVARIKPGHRIFDPFAGSCAILMAASMIEPTIQSVGVEIALDGQVNRDDIVLDFTSRNLTLPYSIIRGDSMSGDIRHKARAAVGNEPFDAIVTDPPYGIREKTGFCLNPPLLDLVKCIAKDRKDGNRLLKIGGRLVAFVPNQSGDDISLDMPSHDDLSLAGLEFCQMLEQPLNESLSRWLVEYKCVE